MTSLVNSLLSSATVEKNKKRWLVWLVHCHFLWNLQGMKTTRNLNRCHLLNAWTKKKTMMSRGWIIIIFWMHEQNKKTTINRVGSLSSTWHQQHNKKWQQVVCMGSSSSTWHEQHNKRRRQAACMGSSLFFVYKSSQRRWWV